MDNALVQAYAPYAAAGLLLLVVIAALAVRRRRGAAEAQAVTQRAYADSVSAYRSQVDQLLVRRAEMVAAIAAIESGRLDEALRDRALDTADAIARLELDVILAGDDEEQRATSLRALRRGVSDLEMLLPEPPTPPAPVARLSRRARARAEAWRQDRTTELAALRRLAEPAPAAGVPAQAGPREVVAAAQTEDALSA